MTTPKNTPWGNADHDFLIRPATCAPDDFWQQVRRTVHGKPISQEQIECITQAVRQNLALTSCDVLLDLCCGNGALSQTFVADCQSMLGVDYSASLLDVARRYFENPPALSFVHDDALAYTLKEAHPHKFTKAFCYGALQYLPPASASALLTNVYQRFSSLSRFFLGNIPDREQAAAFFGERPWTPDVLDDHTTSLGYWYSKSSIEQMAKEAGWETNICPIAPTAYGAQYRFGVLLIRPHM